MTVTATQGSSSTSISFTMSRRSWRLGCNSGTCHGSAQGKNGFKLSLRGYDPLFDVRALSDDLASRRVNPASPDDSLMLLKPSGAVPHVGGQLIQPGEPYYEAIRAWIASSTPRAERVFAQGDEARCRPGQPGHRADRLAAAVPCAGHLRRWRGPRRHPRGIPRERQYRGRRVGAQRPGDRPAPRRGHRSWPGTKGPTPPPP